MGKPPAFQFYAKDWLSSSTRRRMSRADRGLFWDMAAYAWDSETPGLINMSMETFAKVLGISTKVLRNFIKKFPKTYIKVDGKLQQPKLYAQWVSYEEISTKRSMAAKQSRANAQQLHHSAFASASASASAVDQKPPGKPPGAPNPRSESEQRRIVEARDTRQQKEEEARKESMVGTNPYSLQLEISRLAKLKSLH